MNRHLAHLFILIGTFSFWPIAAFPLDDSCHWSGHGWAANATGLWYQKTGTGSAVVLIHGGTLDSRIWNNDINALVENHTVIRYDLRGAGRSMPANAAFSHVNDLHHLLGEIGIDKAHLVGLSLGGGIAIAYALEHPERVSSVTALAPAISGQPVPPDAATPYSDALAAAREGQLADAVAAWLETPAVKLIANSDAAASKCVEAMVRDNLEEALQPSAHSQPPRPPSWQQLELLDIPVLLLIGDSDAQHLRQNVLAAANRLPQATYRELDGGIGHLLNIDAPVAFRKMLLDFLEQNK